MCVVAHIFVFREEPHDRVLHLCIVGLVVPPIIEGEGRAGCGREASGVIVGYKPVVFSMEK